MTNEITNEEIKDIIDELNHEYEFGLSTRQVNNILKRMKEYDIKNNLLLVLKYSCKIKCEINNYLSFSIHKINLKKYYYCNTIDYAIKRVLSIINNNKTEVIYNDSFLENNVSYIETDLRNELKKKKLSLTI